MARVRLIDVAELAGVSMKTVSNVVHNYPHVAPALRKRVQTAIDQLGYRPNLTARRLATGRTGMIALAIPEIDHPYFSELSRHIAEEATRRGYRVLIEQTLSDPVAERSVLSDREAGLVDGVIFHPVRMDSLDIAKLDSGTPLVLLGEAAMPVMTDHVMINNVSAALDATRHLLARGCRRIAFLGVVAADITGSTNQRLLGYQQGLLEAGVQLDPGLVFTASEFTAEAGLRSVVEATERGALFDGVVCRDDRFAIGALKALHDSGRSVPGDVAVVGWDNTFLGAYTSPTLSSVAPDKAAIAAAAFSLLEERIAGYRGVGRHMIVGHSLEVRESAPIAP
ncbi:LacI family transcriptional regulator [Cryobacterium roopkundense]|uniref:DNA-binding LacI/PurR family transcriptional regulator n=1 Tax=Cryobacterium roopkundense TaxID=1001240 RepID=A0A099JBL0_9MICO|nr:LacI family DNA-binding transcriptional regulator [Cryobacterium roopkundense]KGJ74892.1 LacI family transcriptional regulator [Cryobacterium roopkundense]MBB5640600.1 DNA-binding LacI/PurR family transcriptional regulator [Cryobacterium roopkundense]